MSVAPELAAAYRATAVQAASPLDLVLMLYDTALAGMVRAERLIETGAPRAPEEVNRALVRAQGCIAELLASLDPDQSITGELALLYDFVLDRLIAANLRKDPVPLREAREILQGLREAWAVVREGAAEGRELAGQVAKG